MTEALPLPKRNWLVFGEAAEPARPLSLRAGPLQLLYEPERGFVRRVRLGKDEALRGIYAAVRDRNWTAIPAAITETVRSVSADSFHIEFDAVHRLGDINFTWHGSIRGLQDGTLHYTFDGRARSSFLRNRIGLCVLHPTPECTGAAARQRRTDGSVLECRFPERIEPQIVGQSPFRNLKGLAHEISPGIWAELQFSGDVFEMEDQRNWTDASFKTYSTPLARPFPVEITAGTVIDQRVALRLIGHAPKPGIHSGIEKEPARVLDLSFDAAGQSHALNIGLGLASHGQPLTPTEGARLRALRLAHLRADIRLGDPAWPAVWERALNEADQLSTRVELALHLPSDGQVQAAELSRVFLANSDRIARVLALRASEPATSLETLTLVQQIFSDSSLPIGAGTDAHFCDLNREHALGRVPVREADFLFWPMTPQVHATDSSSVLETLKAQPESLRTAHSFGPGKPLVISPITLRPRFNAVATTVPPPSASGTLPASVDPRQISLFAAAWTLGSLAALAGAGAASITLFETTGLRGVIEREMGSPWLADMPELHGQVFPVYHLLAQLGVPGSILATPPGPDLAYAALTLSNGNRHAPVLLTNLKDLPQRFHLTGATSVHVHVLDQQCVSAAMVNPEHFRTQRAVRLNQEGGFIELHLPAYALAFIVV